ncbi:MAG: ABC transporter transmembrane domain-containing protein [Burkholderiaceae bacterium]|nr:ABC transporter transmembrane domain-containing protein [Burkholderiaceae bacterium]MEB2319260.1 ABC transporter transmembrane domain-containing protein [Pseudomonadota bacterium]
MQASPTDPAIAPPAAARPGWRVLAGLQPFLGRYPARLAVAAIALLVAAAATLAVPIAFRHLVDLGFVEGAAADGRGIDGVFLALFGVAVVLAMGTAVRYYSVSWLGERIAADLRESVYSRVLRQDPRFFETMRTGEILSRLSADTTLIQTLVGTSVSLGLRNALLFAGGIAMMLVTSGRLAGLIVALMLIVVAPILAFGRRVRRLSRTSQDRLADASALAGETLGAMAIVQAFVREPLETRRYAAATEAAFASAVRRTRARALLTVLAIVLVFGAVVFVLWLGAQAVMAGSMSPGELAQFVLYAVLVAGAAGAIAEVFGDVQRAAGATERLLDLLHAQPLIRPGTRRLASRGPADPPGITMAFESVGFAYPSRPDDPALVDLSFRAERGETVAIVGPSGAGKTTIFQLLLRFHDPSRGRIRLEGVDTRELTLESLRESMGFVSQDSAVFSVDVMENIRYGRLEASDAEVIAAARAAHAHEFIERLPDGYRTALGERGVRLSGGQRQRIAIARALLRNPPLLLLDEATSALDAESERAVQAALADAMQARTTLVIAHRLATVMHADRILVLDAGRLVESGSHADLVAAGGLYARLAAMQFDGASR